MTALVTGAAGFIGYHVSRALLERGQPVIGVDNLNAYYDVALKQARLKELDTHRHFHFYPLDIADCAAMEALAARHHADIAQIVHLAAQAGVRYSLENPFAYAESNLAGHLVMLELCRAHLPELRHFVYASSSSVYGGNTKLPFSVADRTDTPVSLYAATKKADELLTHSYRHLYGIPATGLRFFTVYGPWGRPDMAYFSFTRALFAGEPIRLFNHGDMKRDFTHIGDIVGGVLACLDMEPKEPLYNLGNHASVPLREMVRVLEEASGRKAELVMEPMQPGDVKETFADISESARDFGYTPRTTIREGLPEFVAWYRRYYGV